MLVNVYCTRRDLPGLAFPHTLRSRRDRTDPELAAHLHGFMGFVMGGGSRPMTATRYHVLRHIERVRHQVALEIEADDLGEFESWAKEANALVFMRDGSVRSPEGRVLVEPETGDAQPGADLPYPPDSVARKAATEAALTARGLVAPAGLPPVISELEVELRDGPAIASRCLALFACALRAESLSGPERLAPDDIASRLAGAEEAMSPKERAFFRHEAPPRQDIVDHVWRYEALWVLLWALGQAPTLPFPEGTCDVAAVAKTLVGVAPEAFVRDARRRPTPELLDALDLHLRLHWLVRDAASADDAGDAGAKVAGVAGGVVQERHHALNWLTSFEDAAWDDVTTPT
jgi:hypothetical protein